MMRISSAARRVGMVASKQPCRQAGDLIKAMCCRHRPARCPPRAAWWTELAVLVPVLARTLAMPCTCLLLLPLLTTARGRVVTVACCIYALRGPAGRWPLPCASLDRSIEPVPDVRRRAAATSGRASGRACALLLGTKVSMGKVVPRAPCVSGSSRAMIYHRLHSLSDLQAGAATNWHHPVPVPPSPQMLRLHGTAPVPVPIST